jgi:Kef-type K+ transport system membrane component KefB
MDTLYTAAALVAAVAAVAWVAERLRLPQPILLVIAGIAFALMPWFPRSSSTRTS